MLMQHIKARLSSLCCLNLGGTVILTTLACLSKNPYAAFLIPIFFGLSVLLLLLKDKNSVPIDILIPLAPAVGFSILILMMYADSALKIGLTSTVVIYNVMTLALASYLCFNSSNKYTLKSQDITDVLAIAIPILFIVLVHWVAYTYPTDNVDNLFHATKIEYIMKYNSMYPKTVPIFDILTYPGGYHSIVAYIISVTKINIPTAMKTFRILAWSLFSLGVYLFSRIWFNKKIARFSVLTIITTNICYYYLIVYIEPNFTGFYFFLTMLSLAYSCLNNDFKKKIQHFSMISIIIGGATILVHPYSFQNFVFMMAVYVLLTQVKSIKKNYVNVIKRTTSLIVIYCILPLGIYTLLNPFFMFPELAKVHIEYPWASYTGVVMSHLTLIHGKNPHDTLQFFKLLLSWSTIRNNNYAEVIFMALSGMYILFRDLSKKVEYATIMVSLIFVFALITNRLTINMGIPFYGTAAIERMYLWLVPLFPILIGMGFHYSYEIAKNSGKISMKVAYILLIFGFFVIPTGGTARDLVSAEANFYVTSDVIADFTWIEEHVHTHYYVLNSCYSDPTPWLPFFEGPNRYTVMFDAPIKRCRFNNMTLNETVNHLMTTNSTLPNTIAYIDTNAPNLNPISFANRYQLLHIGENNWIFNLSSTNIKNNTNTMLKSLKLCSLVLPGDTFEYGRYYILGFTKKYFYVAYYRIEGEPYAWLSGNRGIIAFNPCRKFNNLKISLYTTSAVTLNITVNDKLDGSYKLHPGSHHIQIKTLIVPNKINTIEISKTNGVILIKRITFNEGNYSEKNNH